MSIEALQSEADRIWVANLRTRIIEPMTDAERRQAAADYNAFSDKITAKVIAGEIELETAQELLQSAA